MPSRPSRPGRRRLAAALAAAGVLVGTSACAGVAQPIPAYQDGWSAAHAQGDGANAVRVDGPRTLSLQWTRALGGPPTGSAAAGPDGQLIVSARTDGGCAMFAFDLDTGRKRWCGWQNIGDGTMSPLVDQMAAVYTGNLGSADAFDVYGQQRWHTPVIGTPQPLQFLRYRAVLAVTHLGQVNVLGTGTGRKLAPSVDLAPADWPPPPDTGLADCPDAGPGCPVAFPPAVHTGTDDFYFPFRAPGADGAVLVAMHYEAGPSNRADIRRDSPDADADGLITERWRSRALPGGVASAPALSDDGSTVYVLDGAHTLWALDTADGAPRWSVPLDFATGRTVSVTPGGLVLVGPAGPSAGPVVAVRGEGGAGRIVWQRPALAATGPVAVAANGLGYVVTRAADGAPQLTVLDVADGSTVTTAPLDPAGGDSGVALITGEGRVAVIGSAGLVSVFS